MGVLDENNAFEIKNYEVSLQAKLLTEVVLNVVVFDRDKLALDMPQTGTVAFEFGEMPLTRVAAIGPIT